MSNTWVQTVGDGSDVRRQDGGDSDTPPRRNGLMDGYIDLTDLSNPGIRRGLTLFRW